MRQVWISEAGVPEVLQLSEAPDPTPRAGEVRIRVEACGVNFADALGRMGIYPDAPAIPYVPGYEIAGKVDQVGQGVADIEEGDIVFALTRFGGYSDLVCVPYKQVFRRWEWMSAEDAAGIPVNYLTAYLMLVVMGSLRSGNTVLIHNAGGGVGLAALDICRIFGAKTFGTASAHKHAFLKERGLDHVIDYKSREYGEAIRDLTGGRGVEIILEPQGGPHWSKNYRLLTPTGRLINFGISSAATGKRRSWLGMVRLIVNWAFFSPAKLMNENRGVLGVNLAHLWAETDLLQSAMEQILNWYDEALFRPQIDRSYKFSEAALAHHYIQDRKNIGKVLLTP
jgi:NADPH:quinone reductase-like Zn-dependent oxidoreductase